MSVVAPIVSVDHVGYVYQPGGVVALDDVALEIPPGQRMAIIGQNGSGKSTLVRHLNGLLRPTRGRITFDGRDTTDRTVAQLARTAGLVFQDPDRQIFAGSVRAEVEFGARNSGLQGSQLRESVDRSLATVQLANERGTNPYDLGASRRKLLALASVLAMRTPILVLDEPTTGQDLAGVALVRGVVEETAAEGRTVIAISHDMEFVAEAFERVVVMREGHVVADGPPSSVFAVESWDVLRSTYLEPPLAAVAGQRLGLGSTPTDASLLEALAAMAQ